MCAHLDEIVVEMVERGVRRVHGERDALPDHLSIYPDQDRPILPEEDLMRLLVHRLVEEEDALVLQRQVFSDGVDLSNARN